MSKVEEYWNPVSNNKRILTAEETKVLKASIAKYEQSFINIKVRLGAYIATEFSCEDDPLRSKIQPYAVRVSGLLVDRIMENSLLCNDLSKLSEILGVDYYSVQVAAEVYRCKSKFSTWLTVIVSTHLMDSLSIEDMDSIWYIGKLHNVS